jgi:transposase
VSRRQKEPLRPLTAQERTLLEQLCRSRSEPASHVQRAKALLAVADGKSYTAAASQVGYALGDSVAQLVARFNKEGADALVPRHGGGPAIVYTAVEREMILSEAGRTPDREQDGTATWSLSTLQKSLRNKGLPTLSTYTVWCVLHEAGITFQKNRTWEPTGTAIRKRKAGIVQVSDPDAAAKKT